MTELIVDVFDFGKVESRIDDFLKNACEFASTFNLSSFDQFLSCSRFSGNFSRFWGDAATEVRDLKNLAKAAGIEDRFDMLVADLLVFCERIQDEIEEVSKLASGIGLDAFVDDGVVIDVAYGIAMQIDDRIKMTAKILDEIRNTAKDAVLKKHNKAQARKKQAEKVLEEDLFLWLTSKNVEVYRQTATKMRHRLDLWVPGSLMLELKAGKVTGDDVCQAIDYHAAYERPILLVGKGLTESASRAIDAVNRIVGEDVILFVTWAAVKPYLSTVLKINSL